MAMTRSRWTMRSRRKPLRERSPIAVAVIGLVLLLLIGFAAYRADRLPVIGGGTTYNADFTEAAGLKRGQEVRIAGLKVGKVTGVELKGAKVRVTFRVKDAWIGDATTATIMIKTLLGSKYLALDPLGSKSQRPRAVIPIGRTIAPYDVTTAFDDLGTTLGQVDSGQVAKSMETISAAFSGTPKHVRSALDGLSALSEVIASRDSELASLLEGTRKLSGTIASQNEQFRVLLKDGNLVLAELRRRREAIHALLVGLQRLSIEIVDFVEDNRARIGPVLASLDRITDVLVRNQKDLDRTLKLVGPYVRLLANASGNGRWLDGYLCNGVPREYLTDPATDPAWRPPQKGCVPTRQGGSGQ